MPAGTVYKLYIRDTEDDIEMLNDTHCHQGVFNVEHVGRVVAKEDKRYTSVCNNVSFGLSSLQQHRAMPSSRNALWLHSPISRFRCLGRRTDSMWEKRKNAAITAIIALIWAEQFTVLRPKNLNPTGLALTRYYWLKTRLVNQ